MSSLSIGLFALATLTLSARARTYIGAYDSSRSYFPTYTGYSADNCATACAGYAYALYDNQANPPTQCLCLTSGGAPVANTMINSADPGLTLCANIIKGYDLTSKPDWAGCYTGIDSVPIKTQTVQFQDDCLTFCTGLPGLTFKNNCGGTTLDQGCVSNTYTCGCYATAVVPTAGTGNSCSKATYFLFTQSVTSGTRRKRSQLVLDADRYCPDGKTACSIEETASYECIDTQTELESCGGCTSSAYRNATATVGTDCTALPGIEPFGVSCVSGQCEVHACVAGWTLLDGKCREDAPHISLAM